MKFSKKISALILAVSASAMLLGGCSNKTQMGYYNRDRVCKESPKLEAITKEGKEKLGSMQEELQKKLAEQAQNQNMKAEEVEQQRQQAIMQLQAINQSYASRVNQQIDVVVDQLAKEKKLDAVLVNGNSGRNVIMGGVDITEDIIQKLQ